MIHKQTLELGLLTDGGHLAEDKGCGEMGSVPLVEQWFFKINFYPAKEREARVLSRKSPAYGWYDNPNCNRFL